MLSPVGDAATERSAAGKRFLDAQAAQMKADDAASPRDCRADWRGPQAGDRHPRADLKEHCGRIPGGEHSPPRLQCLLAGSGSRRLQSDCRCSGRLSDLHPYALVRVVVPVVIFIFFLVPALFFAGFWFVVQIIEGSWSFLLTPDAGGIAWWAHIGGFICGAYLVRRLDPGRPTQRRSLPDIGTIAREGRAP